MAQEDYLSGSQFGQVAGSLLAGRRKKNKQDFKKALLATIVFESFGALQKQQKQKIVDGANAIKEEHANIFRQSTSELEDFSDERTRVDEYKRMGESAYANKYATEKMTYSDEAVERGIIWENRKSLPKDVQDSLQDEFNSQRERGIAEIKILLQDPRVKFKTVQAYTDTARQAFLAKDNLLKNDPTQRGVIRDKWNKFFKYDQDGNYTGSNAEKIRMDEELRLATKAYDNQKLQIAEADKRLDDFYSGSVGGSADDLIFNSINTSQKPYDAKTISARIEVNREVIQETKNGKYTGNLNQEFFNIPLEIPIVRTDKDKKDGKPVIELMDIKKGQFKNIKVLDANGQVSNLSPDIFYDALAVHQLRYDDMLLQNGSDALVGAQSIHAVLTKWGKEGRFQKVKDMRTGEGWVDGPEQITWNGDDILLVLPSTNGNNLIDDKVQTSDAIATHQVKGEDNTPELDENGRRKFNPIKLHLAAQNGVNAKLAALTQVERDNKINEYINVYPEYEGLIRKILTNPRFDDNKTSSTPPLDLTSMSERELEEYAEKGGESAFSRSSIFSDQLARERTARLQKYADTGKTSQFLKSSLESIGLEPDATPKEVQEYLDNNNKSLLAKN